MKIYILFSIICSLMLSGCADDTIDNNTTSILPEGQGGVMFTITAPEMPAITRTTSNTETLLDGVSNYAIFFYSNSNGDITDTNDEHWELAQLFYDSNTGDVSSKQSFETYKSVPAGNYKVYVVANLHNKPQNIAGFKYSTIAELKENKMDWNDVTYTNSKKMMFGFFTKADDKPYDSNDKPNLDVTKLENQIDKDVRTYGVNLVNPTDYDAPVIEIKEGYIQAHLTAKLYRMASMVSVYFDTYNLTDNLSDAEKTKILIKDVRLINVPKSCYLWKNNIPTEFIENDIIEINEEISRKENFQDPGRNEFKDNSQFFNTIFYFFENRQGTTDNIDGDGGIANKTVKSNIKPHATYLELRAEIDGVTRIYRCALGEDGYTYLDADGNKALNSDGTPIIKSDIVYNNYNVTRNRHYKVYFTFTQEGCTKDVAGSWRIELDDFKIVQNGYDIQFQNGENIITTTSWEITSYPDWAEVSATSGTGDIKFSYSPKSSLKEKKTYEGNITLKYIDYYYGYDIQKDIPISYVIDKEFGTNVYFNKDAVAELSKIYTGTPPKDNRYENTYQYFAYTSGKIALFLETETTNKVEDFSIGTSTITIKDGRTEFTPEDIDGKNVIVVTMVTSNTENAFYKFNIYAKGFVPKENITIVKNATLDLGNSTLLTDLANEETGTNGVTTKKENGNGCQSHSETDPLLPSVKIGDTASNDLTYYHMKGPGYGKVIFTLEEAKTVNIVARPRYDGSQTAGLRILDNNGNELQKQYSKVEHGSETYGAANKVYSFDLGAGTYTLESISEMFVYCITLSNN